MCIRDSVGTVRVGARAEECEGESNDEGSGAHVCCVLSCLSNARSEVWACDEPDEVGHVIFLLTRRRQKKTLKVRGLSGEH